MRVGSSPIHAFGLFWEREEVHWFPGRGNRFRLLGRRGTNSGTIQMVDFRDQRGIYILYTNHGPYYVGLARSRSLGDRLKDHLADDYDNWVRFSWFGFRQILKSVDEDGLQKLRHMPVHRPISPHTVIKEMEALLIKAMALNNRADSKFVTAKEWQQVTRDQQDRLLERLA